MKLRLIVLFSIFCVFGNLPADNNSAADLAPSILLTSMLNATVTLARPAIIISGAAAAGYTVTTAAGRAATATSHTNAAAALAKLAPVAAAFSALAVLYTFSPTAASTVTVVAAVALIISPNK